MTKGNTSRSSSIFAFWTNEMKIIQLSTLHKCTRPRTCFLSWFMFYATSGFYTQSSNTCPFIKLKLKQLLWIDSSYILMDEYSTCTGIIHQSNTLSVVWSRHPHHKLGTHTASAVWSWSLSEALSSSWLVLNSFVLKQEL